MTIMNRFKVKLTTLAAWLAGPNRLLKNMPLTNERTLFQEHAKNTSSLKVKLQTRLSNESR